MQLVLRDPNQGPFLSKVIAYGRDEQLLSDEELAQIKAKAMLMSLKLADKFYNKYKMHLLEQAAFDVIGVVSLGLIALTERNESRALSLLQQNDGVVKSFQKGWSMLTVVSQFKQNGKSIYGDVDKNLMEQVSCPPDSDEWQGWQSYQDALSDHQRQQAIAVLRQHFYHIGSYDPLECLNLEGVLAEAVLYRICFGDIKVREDLKRKIGQIELNPAWFAEDYIQVATDKALALLPAESVAIIKADLGKHFNAGILRTLQFAQHYRTLLLADASPEKLERFEYKEGLHGLLGWPVYLQF
ncbi:hypothetical protein FJQ87_11725 [Shewanella sp. SNU WT4]|uniref:cold adaptation protein AtcC n=1 Tax=Shewanella sp. SNU WT4 TaxID=2590015 RepID=UPI00112DED26|nr:hypothetical protein [Shewanella sp. SNU WT4]QDF67273.1 hypothetical protein FJQ87_11725 [Shewanella sp. SNU WT4]